MTKHLITLLIILTFITSCQKDDFCVDPITPNLVIRFYDNLDPEDYKKVSELSVWADGLEKLYTEASLDSIALPLDPSKDFTIYHLSKGDIEDIITIDYLRNEVFVSRSCGYKYNFSELDTSNESNNWIINTEITNQLIENETEHIKILH